MRGQGSLWALACSWEKQDAEYAPDPLSWQNLVPV